MGIGGTLTVTNTPGADLALTNCAYCSSSDLRRFMVPGLGQALASIGSSMVLTLRPHESILDGFIALNAIQRRHAKVSTGDTISVSRFVPPEKKFKLVLLTLELEFVKAKGKTEQKKKCLRRCGVMMWETRTSIYGSGQLQLKKEVGAYLDKKHQRV